MEVEEGGGVVLLLLVVEGGGEGPFVCPFIVVAILEFGFRSSLSSYLVLLMYTFPSLLAWSSRVGVFPMHLSSWGYATLYTRTAFGISHLRGSRTLCGFLLDWIMD